MKPGTLIAPIYPYRQFAGEENIRAFFDATNQVVEGKLQELYRQFLPCWVGENLTHPYLEWSAFCIYGQFRYKIIYLVLKNVLGTIDDTSIDALAIDDTIIDAEYDGYSVSDDVFKRIMTWNFSRADGYNFSIPWLKKRIKRFLTGVNGRNFSFNSTADISITLDDGTVNIVIFDSAKYGNLIGILSIIMDNGILHLPPVFKYNVKGE